MYDVCFRALETIGHCFYQRYGFCDQSIQQGTYNSLFLVSCARDCYIVQCLYVRSIRFLLSDMHYLNPKGEVLVLVLYCHDAVVAHYSLVST